MTEYIKYEGEEDELLEVNSSIVEVETFIESILHQDYQREIEIRMEMLTKMLDDFNVKYSGRDYDMFRGGKRVLLEMKNLFHDIKEGLIDKTGENLDEN